MSIHMTGSSDPSGNFPFLAIETFGGRVLVWGFFFSDFIQISVDLFCLSVWF